MELAWWHALGKDNRGSRPRCVLLADGNRHAVAARLTNLVSLPDVTVSPNDLWMPYGKPVKTGKGWKKIRQQKHRSTELMDLSHPMYGSSLSTGGLR